MGRNGVELRKEGVNSDLGKGNKIDQGIESSCVVVWMMWRRTCHFSLFSYFFPFPPFPFFLLAELNTPSST